jgi:hypothetical protein
MENNSILKCYTHSILGKEGINIAKGDESYVHRLKNQEIGLALYSQIKSYAKYIGVTQNFKEVIDYFNIPEGETPAGFKVEYSLESDGICKADLVRDISYDKNGIKRPTKLLFSADSANPYEVYQIKDMVANLTCNPAIIYNMFINNPQANIGQKFKTRDEVMDEIGKILGPGCDISVEINDPFNASDEEILEECARFSEMLSKYRVVIKIPHTGPVNAENVKELLEGDKKFNLRWNQGINKDRLRGHNLAIMLKEKGYRVNFTLMFEPYQTALALQARPYFINSFIMFRHTQSKYMFGLLKAYEATGDDAFMDMLKQYMIDNDYIGANEANMDMLKIKNLAEFMLKYRGFDDKDCDGLDSIRHNLRVLRKANMSDTRLIICNFQGDTLYPYIDKLLMEDEFKDMSDRIVITTAPEHLSQFTSSPLVVQFHRRFMNAAKGQK